MRAKKVIIGFVIVLAIASCIVAHSIRPLGNPVVPAVTFATLTMTTSVATEQKQQVQSAVTQLPGIMHSNIDSSGNALSVCYDPNAITAHQLQTTVSKALGCAATIAILKTGASKCPVDIKWLLRFRSYFDALQPIFKHIN